MRLQRLSKAELESYVICPRLFYYRRIFRKDKEYPLGSLFHDYHWWFWEQIRLIGPQIKTWPDRRHLAEVRSLAMKAPLPIQDWALSYAEWEHERWKMEKETWHDSIPEMNVEAEIGGIHFIGRIDRVDTLKDGIRVVEIKTGAIVKTAWRQETAFYALILEQMGVFDAPVIYWGVWHPEIQIGGKIHALSKKAVIRWISKLKTACEEDEFPKRLSTFCPSCRYFKLCVPKHFPSEVFRILKETGEVMELF